MMNKFSVRKYFRTHTEVFKKINIDSIEHAIKIIKAHLKKKKKFLHVAMEEVLIMHLIM